MTTRHCRLALILGLSLFLSACSIAPGSFVEFRSLKDSKGDARSLNSQVSVTAVDAGVIRRLSKTRTDLDRELLSALEAERNRYEYRSARRHPLNHRIRPPRTHDTRGRQT